ncbi:metalloprotease [Agaricicola taiwanensis]|uniref:Metalloprotease n=1 Tax=Agaricicola taiwanensis TaxID=591372 RepID=A0A8J3DXL9_9RHOB|nr:M48 family metalloprotease [Agaricicola taiwanensis]GGE51809.1 metalloprotease [Agaricicola taiwanensis]
MTFVLQTFGGDRLIREPAPRRSTHSRGPVALLRSAGTALGLGLAVSACSVIGTSEPPTAASSVPSSVPRVVGAQTPAQREHARILASYGGAYQDPALDELLAGVAKKLAAQSARPDIGYRVTVLNTPSINAFALPSGDLYITRGVVALANDTSEVAAVLAHEMAHVAARHAFERADRERQAQLVSRVVSGVLNDPEASALALAKSKLALARFSRVQELEADQLGIRTLAKTGYDPYAAGRFLGSMARAANLRARMGANGETPDFLSTHPSTPERVQLAVQGARHIAPPNPEARDKDAFLAAINGIVYGDDPRQGLVRGRRFVHPVLGFTLTAPEGFVLENTSEALVGVGPGGYAMRLDAEKVSKLGTPQEALEKGVVEGTEVSDIEPAQIGGMPAALGVARGRDWTFRVAAIQLDDDIYRLVFAARELTPETDARFREAIQSFRRLTSEEVISTRPQRLSVITVKPGESIESIAARMPFSDRAVERLLVLNGMEPGAQLTAGQKMKTVVE